MAAIPFNPLSIQRKTIDHGIIAWLAFVHANDGHPFALSRRFWSTHHQFQEGKLKEAAVRYEPDFEEWDAFVSEVLEWL